MIPSAAAYLRQAQKKVGKNMQRRQRSKGQKGPAKKPVRYLFVVLGCAAVALGAAGAVLPLLPSTPFFLLAGFCFAKGSQRLYDRLRETSLYKKHLESFVEQRAMTVKTKLSALISVTLLTGLGFFMMKNVPVGSVLLPALWAGHVLYFLLRIKTLRADRSFPIKSQAQNNGKH
jgi:uncharacterized membrane protein YbaN (DUF454 family)